MSILLDARPEAPDAEPEPASIAKPQFRDDVQGLRAIAVVLVVLYHAGFAFEGGFVGVDAFFVLSGFVIARRVRWEVTTTGTVDIREFLGRRIVRILPAVTLMTGVTLVASMFLAPISGRTQATNTAFASILFHANIQLAQFGGGPQGYFGRLTDLNPFLHTWSLAVEEQFYLVFPFLVLAIAAHSRRRGRNADTTTFVCFAVIAAASFVASLVAIRISQPLAFYLAPLRAWEFLIGAMLVWIERIKWPRSTSWLLGGGGLVILVVSSLVFRENENFPGLLAVVPVIATSLLILGGSGEQTRLTQLLGRPGPSFVGRVSYAWYLWHWPFIVFAFASFPGSEIAVLVAVVASFGIAVASTIYFEEKIRERSFTFSDSLRLGLLCIVVSMGFLVGSQQLFHLTNNSATIEAFDEDFRLPEVPGDVCTSISQAVPDCTQVVDNARGNVVLLGDSTAYQYSTAVLEASLALDHNLTMAHVFACGTNGVDIAHSGSGRLVGGCKEFWDGALQDLRESPPDVLIVAVALDRYVNADTVLLRGNDGEWRSEAAGRADIFEPAMFEMMADIDASVENVIFVGITPKFGQWEPAECSLVRWQIDAAGCSVEATWDELDAERAVGLDIQRRIVSENDIALLDLDDSLCSEDGCSAMVDGEWVFRDYGHVSDGQSLLLTSDFEAAIEAAITG